MSINIRSRIPPANSVGTTELKDGAVTSPKLADLAVTTDKIADEAVTVAKAEPYLKTSLYLGDETEVEVYGNTETEKKTFSITKALPGLNIKRLKFTVELKSATSAASAFVNIYQGATSLVSVSSVSTSYERATASYDCSGWATGYYPLSVKLYSATSEATAYNRLFEMWAQQ